MTTTGLAAVTDQDLAALVGALDRGDLRAPLHDGRLQANGFGHLVEPLRPYLGLGPEGLRAVAEVALAERRHRKAPSVTLVWSGDDPGISHSRHTRVVLPELFARARKHVLIAGYSIDRGADFEVLHRTMREHGVTAELFVDVKQLEERLKQAAKHDEKSWALVSLPVEAARGNEARGRAVVALFFQLIWTFGEPKPVVYFDPRTAGSDGSMSMHAKCVIIDHEHTLITSANFTGRAQTRNIEAGVSIEDRAFATSLERQWSNLVQAGVVVRA